MSRYLILDTSGLFGNRRRYLQGISARGLTLTFVTDPAMAKAFATRDDVNRCRALHPHIGGRVVLRASEIKRHNAPKCITCDGCAPFCKSPSKECGA